MEKKRVALGLGVIFIIIISLYYFYSLRNQAGQPLTLYGNVDIRTVNPGFRVGGRLMELNVDEGDDVHRGDLLARLEPAPYIREVRSQQAFVNQQKADLAYKEVVFAREKKLSGTGASSIDRYQNALASRDAAKASLDKAEADLSQAALRLEDTWLYSPSDGVVLTRAVEPGTMLAANATVITISLTNPVWVRAYISERELGKAKQGRRVLVYTDSNPDKSFEGKIGFVSSTAEFTPKTVETTDLRTDLVYRLRIVMQDPTYQLRQGMPVTVKLVD